MTNGEVYRTESGYEFSGYGTSSSFAAPSLDLSGILQIGAVTQEDLASGVYDNASVYFFATSFADGESIEDEEPLAKMFFGAVSFDDGKNTYQVQLMGAIDVLSQSTGRTYTASCPWTLFDETLDGVVPQPLHSRCTGPRASPDGPALADFKVTGALTGVTSQYVFTDSSRAEADDWFGYGEIKFTTGQNAGLRSSQIKSFSAGVIELHEALFFAPSIGDEYEMIPGCRKRHIEDCKTKWSNVVNFGGQPHVPPPTVYSQVGRK